VQSVIEGSIPYVELQYKYKLPLYYFSVRPYCYLNQSKDYVDLGFWNAAHLTIHLDKMNTKGRKMMKSLRYKSLEEIDVTVLREVLQDAYSVKDKKFWK
jgi:hypothetical protein